MPEKILGEKQISAANGHSTLDSRLIGSKGLMFKRFPNILFRATFRGHFTVESTKFPSAAFWVFPEANERWQTCNFQRMRREMEEH